MDWNSEELRQADALVRFFDTERIRPTPRPVQPIRLSAEAASALADGVHIPSSGRLPLRAIAVRHLFQALGLDEHRLFRLHFEHKLVQALVLNHYCPDCIPVTRGLHRFLAQCPKRSDKHSLRSDFWPWFVKRSRGYGTVPTNGGVDDHTLWELSEALRSTVPISLAEEDWIIQEKLAIVNEYRVHTLEDTVIQDLTYHRHSNRHARVGRDKPTAFVAALLCRVPKSLFSGALWGWDIAETADQRLWVIEINISGYHPVWGTGFQCSGFLQHPAWGPLAIARLVRSAEEKYSAQIIFEPGPGTSELDILYGWIQRWAELLRVSRAIQALSDDDIRFLDTTLQTQYSSAADSYNGIVRKFVEASALIE